MDKNIFNYIQQEENFDNTNIKNNIYDSNNNNNKNYYDYFINNINNNNNNNNNYDNNNQYNSNELNNTYNNTNTFNNNNINSNNKSQLLNDNNNHYQNYSKFEENKLLEINSLLNLRGFKEINFTNIFNNNNNNNNYNQDININLIEIIQNLQAEIEKLISNNIELKQKLLKFDDENYSLKQKIKLQNEEKEKIEMKINSLNNQINFIDEDMKNKKKNFFLEKNELNKIIAQIQLKENAYMTEINKMKKEKILFLDKFKNLQEKFDKEKNLNFSNGKNMSMKFYNNNKNNNNIGSNNSNSNSNFNQSFSMEYNNNKKDENFDENNYNNNFNNFNNKNLLNNFDIKNNSLRNSNYFKRSSGSLKEFYLLLFQGIEKRIKFVISENEEIKDCIKSLIDELSKIIEFKNKTTLKNLIWTTNNNTNNTNTNANNDKNNNLINNNYNSQMIKNSNIDNANNNNYNNNNETNHNNQNHINNNNIKINITDKDKDKDKDIINNNNSLHEKQEKNYLEFSNIINNKINNNINYNNYDPDLNLDLNLNLNLNNKNISDFFSSENSRFKLKALLELNKEDFITELNEFLKIFREVYLYDTIKLNPSKEFNFSFLESERQNFLIDNKQKLNNLPFYESIKDFFVLFSNENYTEFYKNLQNLNSEIEKISKNLQYENENEKFNEKETEKSNKKFNENENENEDFFDKQSFNSGINTIKISMKDSEIPNFNNINMNTITGRQNNKFSDFNSQGFNINEIMIKLDDKLQRINSDVKNQIEDMENKMLLIDEL
jgi:hypothetical protein